ncbi:MAG TPA: hypothetical protein VFZ10_11815, partial [Geminicoccaceae bacterium]
MIALRAPVDLDDEHSPLHHPCDLPESGSPALVVVVDTEEEFDWSAPFDRAGTAVGHMAAIGRVQDVFDAVGVIPSYLVSYAIVAHDAGYRPLEPYLAAGRAVIGAHLNPWTTPPHSEELSAANSYPGNLPRELEAAKLAALARQIERALGVRPTLYKAGRYGKGPHTEALLEEQGFEVDMSPAPAMDLSADGGPDYARQSPRPFLFGRARRLLCLPNTGAFVGCFHALGPVLHSTMQHPALTRLHLPALASRLGLLERLRLTPEGYTLAEMRRLTRALLARGQRSFVVSLHSPSVVPGNTPYVRSEADLALLLMRLRGYLAFFRDELRGRFVTPHGLKAELEQLAPHRPREQVGSESAAGISPRK